MTEFRIARAGVWLAMAVTVALFLCSLLVLVSAPNAWLSIVAIVISEWGHFAALFALFLGLVTVRAGRIGAINAAIAFVTAALCVSPAIGAALIAHSLKSECKSAFGHRSMPAPEYGRTAPLSIVDMFRGVPTSGVNVSEHVYATVRSKSLELDLYRAADAVGTQPLIVVLYGGGWKRGSRHQLRPMNRYLARQHYTVAAISYRHAPKWPFPAAVDDLFRAINFLKANAAEFQIDPARIILIGRSAGGQIALSAAYAEREPAIRGVVSLYGPTDLVLAYERPSQRAVLDWKTVLEDYLGGSPAQNSQGYAAASPANHVGPTVPPTLLIHGGLDPFVRPIHSELLAQRLQEAGVKHLYLRLPWATHGADANLSGPSGQLSLYAIECLLATAAAPAP